MHFKPILASYIMNFQVVEIIGGGEQNNMFAPQYFHWGATAPLPPRIDASVEKVLLL